MVAPEQARCTKVTELFESSFSIWSAASAGPARRERWQSEFSHTSVLIGLIRAGERQLSKSWPLTSAIRPFRSPEHLGSIEYCPGTSGDPSPEAYESPIETIKNSFGSMVRRDVTAAPRLS